MIELRDIDQKNFNECIELKVSTGQTTYVAPNLMSIAQAKIMPDLEIKAVYSEETMVGFVMYGHDPDRDRHYLVRLMVGEEFQGQGFGRAATKSVIESLRKTDGCDSVYLCFVPGNIGAERLYESVGFERTGEMDEGEVEMRYVL